MNASQCACGGMIKLLGCLPEPRARLPRKFYLCQQCGELSWVLLPPRPNSPLSFYAKPLRRTRSPLGTTNA